MKPTLLVVLVLFGCQEQPKPKAETSKRGAACTAALGSFDRFVDTGDPDTPPEQRAKIKAALLDRCLQDAWSDPALACMKKAGTSHEVFACWNNELSKEQREAASKALGQLP